MNIPCETLLPPQVVAAARGRIAAYDRSKMWRWPGRRSMRPVPFAATTLPTRQLPAKNLNRTLWPVIWSGGRASFSGTSFGAGEVATTATGATTTTGFGRVTGTRACRMKAGAAMATAHNTATTRITNKTVSIMISSPCLQ